MTNKTKTSFWIAILMAVTLIQSCSVQQRRYTGGWSIQWPTPNAKNAKLTGSVNKSAEPAVAMRQSSAEAIKIANPQNSESAKLQNVEISGNAFEPKNKGENSEVRPSLTMNKTVQPTYPNQGLITSRSSRNRRFSDVQLPISWMRLIFFPRTSLYVSGST